jgi:voltage-gated potassium channel
MQAEEQLGGWRASAHEIIFESDTKAGKAFDVALILAIVISVGIVMIESVEGLGARYGHALRIAEWTFTILFTFEYILRLICVGKPMRYARSFFGVVDLIAILPTYLSIFVPGAQYALVVRSLRILRIFRVLKLAHHLSETEVLVRALVQSRRKITVFLFAVFTLVVILGSLMYLIEGREHGFTSIPRGIYWAIVTLTTVGYGDISPETGLGQALASIVMVLGFAIIAIPTGIVTAELARGSAPAVSGQACPECAAEGHAIDAVHCRICGEKL